MKTIQPLLLLFVVIGLANGGADWKINFSSHPNNVGIEGWMWCNLNRKLVWFASPYVHVEPDWTEVLMHRETRGIPHGAQCSASFQVKRNENPNWDSDPSKDYAVDGEAATITWTQP